jgi:hypothetical protein
LHGQRREAFDLLRVGDQDLPTKLFERVVHKPRAGHRLDDRANAMAGQVVGQMPQAVGVRRRGSARDDPRRRR